MGVRVLVKSSPPSNRGCREGQASAEACGPRATKKHAAEPQVSRTTRPSLRDGFTDYTQSPRRPARLPPSSRKMPLGMLAKLDLSIGRPEPCDFTVRDVAYVRAPKHAAPHRGHRIPHPTLRDVRAASLFNEAGWGEESRGFGKSKADYFSHCIWTGQISLSVLHYFAFSRMRLCCTTHACNVATASKTCSSGKSPQAVGGPPTSACGYGSRVALRLPGTTPNLGSEQRTHEAASQCLQRVTRWRERQPAGNPMLGQPIGPPQRAKPA